MGVIISKSGNGINHVIVKIDDRKLKALKAQLAKKLVVRVGVLGTKAVRKNSAETELNNAEIGLIHEKGVKSKNIPRRSFLEVPLSNGMYDAQDKIGKKLDKALKENDIAKFFAQMGVLAEGIVLMAFGNHGYFGEWPALVSRKGSPLIDTGQLRKSITHEVKEG